MSDGLPKGAARPSDAVPLAKAYSDEMPEREFQGVVERLLQEGGWLHYHTFDSRRSDEGFPDICAVRGDRLLFAELKSAAGKPTEAQTEWLKRLALAGAECYLWRPAELERISEVLA